MDFKLASGQNANYVKPVITGCIGGFAGALIVGLIHVAADLYRRNGAFGTLIVTNKAFGHFIDIAAAFGTAFLLSWILYRETEKSNRDSQTVSETVSETGVVYSPIRGQVVSMEEVPDDTFAAKVLGDGMAVIPSEGKVYAPFDGKVEMLYDTKHAIAISSRDGIEVLIHVGINTVELSGRFYETYVSDGALIHKGDLLLRFDIAGIKEAGYSTVTPIVVTNSDDYDAVLLLGKGVVDNQDILMKI